MKNRFKVILFTAIGFSLFFSLSATAQEYGIPSWIKNTALWYGQGQTSDTEFINSLQYLIDNGILTVGGNAVNSNNNPVTNVQDTIKDEGDFYITYYANPNSVHEYSAKQWIQDLQYFENQVEYLNQNFRLPYDVEIVAMECNEANAFYDWETKQIIICYEFIDIVYEDFVIYLENEIANNQITDEDLDDASYSVIDFVFYHELAHALIDVYQLPITGLEENAADQFATYFQLLTEDDENVEGILSQDLLYNVGTWFYIQTLYENEPVYWDTHNLDIQRFYNISCYAYGQNPEYNQDLIEEEWLPEERAINCEYEYAVLEDSWTRILTPFFL